MALIALTCTDIIKRTPTITSFRFAPASALPFLPGQFLHIMFDRDHPGNRQLNKYLSFSCAPGKPYIEVTKRLSASDFSSHLRALKPGDVITTGGALGTCVYRDTMKKIGFLVGGIGITPVISIMEYCIETHQDTDLYLLYSNRDTNDIAFLHELDTWQARWSRLRVTYTVTDCVPTDNRCIRGHINADMLRSVMPDFTERVIFVFGPPAMVTAVKNLCLEASCVSSQLHTEQFVGY